MSGWAPRCSIRTYPLAVVATPDTCPKFHAAGVPAAEIAASGQPSISVYFTDWPRAVPAIASTSRQHASPRIRLTVIELLLTSRT